MSRPEGDNPDQASDDSANGLSGLAIGLPLGVAIGVSLGVALDNIEIGVAIGTSMGLAFSAIPFASEDAADGDEEKPPSG